MNTPSRSGRWIAGGLALVAVIGLARIFVGVSFVVGDSMLPTFATGDLLVVNKWAYRSRDPQRGDLVVARCQTDSMVKRVVGLPREEVELVNGEVYVNGERLAEPYPRHPGYLSLRKGRLFGGRWALLGDNRDLPRMLVIDPVVEKSQILGQVVYAWHWRRAPTPG